MRRGCRADGTGDSEPIGHPIYSLRAPPPAGRGIPPSRVARRELQGAADEGESGRERMRRSHRPAAAPERTP